MIYLDNAATSWPKPATVHEALQNYYSDAGGNPGRSGHRMSIAAGHAIEDARAAVTNLLGAGDPSRIAFTANATHALNLALYGVLKPGDHVVTTSIEHNSVMRPLRHLETLGTQVTVVACGTDGTLDLDEVRRAFTPATRLVAATHASNVTGTLLPVAELAAMARERGVASLVDASQTAGAQPIDVRAMGVDLLAFTGHKGLLGPTGTGGLYIREGVALTPLMRGGTGSESAHESQPDFLPDAYESGTANVAGLVGLAASVHFLSDLGVDAVRSREEALVSRFLEAALRIPGLTVYGPRDPSLRCGLVSFNVAGASPSEVALLLDDSFGIMARAGLHCAPSAHRTVGTFPTGAVRFSFGWFNTTEEVDAATEALRAIADWSARGTVVRS